MLWHFQTESSVETGMPLDKLTVEAKSWVKSVGSNATTLSEILKSKDTHVSLEDN